MSNPVVKLEGVMREFSQGRSKLHVLKGVNLEINPGEVVALVGPSGSGKSTMLHITGLLERPDSGEVYIDGQPTMRLRDDGLTTIRRKALGFVYQYHHLLPEFSALENVVIPQVIDGRDAKEAKVRGAELLDWMGLTERQSHRPGMLSGGEQQRVAIARALANGPKLLLADEPTGNLDPHTADGVFEVLTKLVRGAGLSALIATHNPDLAARMDRTLRLEDGHLIEA